MPKIRVLPEQLINQIAAGEIVERPASAVKELMENSLDAGAGQILVETEGGGKARITVRDDGEGMSRDDALLAFEHHATSKIRSAADLETVATMGFRGEALPSIAAVSRLTLKTAAAAEAGPKPGTQVEIHGGVIRAVKDIAWAKGTEITVENLFYNLPARKKFLKADATENAHIAKFMTHYALAFPRLHISLASNRRTVLDAPPAGDLAARVHQLFGAELLEDLIPLAAGNGTVTVAGFVSGPHEKRASTDGQYFFINRRLVRDRVLSMALSQTYRGVLPAGQYPLAILFVEVPPEEVDVNVHPAKTEVRFRESWQVQQFIRSVLEDALHRARPFARFPAGSRETPGNARLPEDGLAELTREVHERRREAAGPASAVREAPAGYTGPGTHKPWLPVPDSIPVGRPSADGQYSPATTAIPGPPAGEAPAAAPGGSAIMPQAWHPDHPWRILGQWNNSFIIAGSTDELLIIDQHVAHERILFEEILAQFQAGDVVRQRLLIPRTVELAPGQVEILEFLTPVLNGNGFEIEPFGERSILVKSVPAAAAGCEAELLLQEILSRLDQPPEAFTLDEIRHRLAAGLACRAAVKINTPLDQARMEQLVTRLLAAGDPSTCPHGRPVVLKIHRRELEKSFKRI